MRKIVILTGEAVIGDGFAYYYDEDADERLCLTESSEQLEGFISALNALEVDYEIIYFDEDEASLEWDEASEWWEKRKNLSLSEILTAAENAELYTP